MDGPSPNSILVALGANLDSVVGGPVVTLGAALVALSESGLPPARVARFYRSPCHPAGAGPDYVNSVAALRNASGLSPRAALERLHDVEARFGRERRERWGARSLDLDLLAHGDAVAPDAGAHARWRNLDAELRRRETPAELVLPHPRLQDRAFVLVPLAEIAPNWTNPATGETVGQMLAKLSPGEVQSLKPL